jgi:F-type H+-transporting ATPase subunit a
MHLLNLRFSVYVDAMLFFSPFEQFEINIVYRLFVSQYDFSITNLTIYLILTVISVLSIMFFVTKKLYVVPKAWQALIEIIYTFILGLIIEQTGVKGRIYSLRFFQFLVYFIINLLGLPHLVLRQRAI